MAAGFGIKELFMTLHGVKKDIGIIVIMLLTGLVFFLFLGEQGTILCKDSPQYLEYEDFNAVMPFYPSVIDVIRTLFGQESFLQYIYIIQGLIALVCSMYMTLFFKKYFNLEAISTFVIFVFSLLPYAYTLPEYVSSHEVMTESLAFPIFYLFFIALLELYDNVNLWTMIKLMAYYIMLVMLRSQLLFLIGVVGIVFIISRWSRIREILTLDILKKGLLVLLAIFMIIGAALVIRQKKAEASGESASQIANAFLGKALTIMEADDVEHFEDENDKEMFNRVFKAVDEKEQRLVHARKDLLVWEDMIVFYNENMKLGNDELYYYFSDIYPDYDYYQKLELVELAKTRIIKAVVLNNLGTFLYSFLIMLPSGFLCIVFLQRRSIYTLCNIYALLFYISYFVLMIGCFKRNKVFSRELKVAFGGMLISILNVLCTNLVHYALQRYLVYTMGLLYIAMFVMIRSFLKKESVE